MIRFSNEGNRAVLQMADGTLLVGGNLISDSLTGSHVEEGAKGSEGRNVPRGMCAEERLVDLTRVEFDGYQPDLVKEIDSIKFIALTSRCKQMNGWSEFTWIFFGWNFAIVDIPKVLYWNGYRWFSCSMVIDLSILRNLRNRVRSRQMKYKQVTLILFFEKGTGSDFFTKCNINLSR